LQKYILNVFIFSFPLLLTAGLLFYFNNKKEKNHIVKIKNQIVSKSNINIIEFWRVNFDGFDCLIVTNASIQDGPVVVSNLECK